MKDLKLWNSITRYLAGENTIEEEKVFNDWLSQDDRNKELFFKVKIIWDESKSSTLKLPSAFHQRFTKNKIKDFILNQALGNLIGFIVGMWVTVLFSTQVLEKRSVTNLFGLGGRKTVVVNTVPEWMQKGLSILIGFIALETINHFFQTRQHIRLWSWLKSFQRKAPIDSDRK